MPDSSAKDSQTLFAEYFQFLKDLPPAESRKRLAEMVVGRPFPIIVVNGVTKRDDPTTREVPAGIDVPEDYKIRVLLFVKAKNATP